MVFLFGNNNNYSSQKQEMSDLIGKNNYITTWFGTMT